MKAKLAVGFGVLALGAVLAVGLLRGDERRRPSRPKPRGGKLADAAPRPAPARPKPAKPEDLQALLAALSEEKQALSRDEVLAILREAAAARKTRDIEAFNRALAKLAEHGASLQKLLARILLDHAELELREVAAVVLSAVATAEICPFMLTLAQVESSEDIRAVALSLLAKFRFAEAAPYLEYLLFDDQESLKLRALAIEYFAATGGETVLVRALRDVELLREKAADALVAIGTETAGRAIYDLWAEAFRGKQAMGNYFLLQALARIRTEVLALLLDEGLRSITDSSQKNILVSLLAHADRNFALERVRALLAGAQETTLRRQALHVAANLGGPEGQRILLDSFLKPASRGELLAAVNGLLRQETLEVDFSEILSLHSGQKDPVLRAVLASLLARDEALSADPSLAASLLNEAERNLAAEDPGLKAVSVDLAASLAKYAQDPAAKLRDVYEKLSPGERDAHPAVLEAMGAYADRPEARNILVSSLEDEAAAAPRRAVAGDALFAAGNVEPVFGAIRDSKDPQTTSLLAGVALVRGGETSRARLREIATSTEGEKRKILLDQLDAWS